jgi:prefoldin subunit 5
MDKTLLTEAGPQPTAGRVAGYKAAIAQMFAEMQVLNEQIKETQAETDRVRAETREILACLRAV